MNTEAANLVTLDQWEWNLDLLHSDLDNLLEIEPSDKLSEDYHKFTMDKISILEQIEEMENLIKGWRLCLSHHLTLVPGDCECYINHVINRI